MKSRIEVNLLILIAASALRTVLSVEDPNLIVIMTDEHNLRTIGAYRKLMNTEQAFPWGPGVELETPNIDRLASEGALFNNFYAVSPLCTPSRASFMTGLYPKFTGSSWKNHGKLNKKRKTFANELRALKGYATSYLGKWHLNGKKSSTTDFGDKSRKFGFQNIDYQYNRGHWKYFNETANGITAFEWSDRSKFVRNGMNENDYYATDFLFDKAKDFIREKAAKGKNFAVMLSIADPHDPNNVRAPYDTMFDHLNFGLPSTAQKAMHSTPALPSWAAMSEFTPLQADELITDFENDQLTQDSMRQVFGMIKLVDDKIGRLLKFLEKKGLDQNTIIVMTSDHGDMMYEHGRTNKGVPFKASAQVPFLVRWPKGITPGKVINTAYSSVDFVPTILGLMGVESRIQSQGIDGSAELLGNELVSINEDQIRFLTDSKQRQWVAAITNRYKLVLSEDIPWFFDMDLDPDELINFYNDPTYAEVVAKLQPPLIDAVTSYKLSMEPRQFLAGTPACYDSKDEIPGWDNRLCEDLHSTEFSAACIWDFVSAACPRVCNKCCDDSIGEIWLFGSMKTCDMMNTDAKFCTKESAQLFCPSACGLCA